MLAPVTPDTESYEVLIIFGLGMDKIHQIYVFEANSPNFSAKVSLDMVDKKQILLYPLLKASLFIKAGTTYCLLHASACVIK